MLSPVTCYMLDGPHGKSEHGPFNAKAWHCMKKMIGLKLSIWKQLFKWMLGAFTSEFEPKSWIDMSLHSYLKRLFKAIFSQPYNTGDLLHVWRSTWYIRAWSIQCKSVTMKKMIALKTTFQVNARCFYLRIRTRELNSRCGHVVRDF